MKLRFELPSVVVVCQSDDFYNTFKEEIQNKYPDLRVVRVGFHVAIERLPKFRPIAYKTVGFDYWIPKESMIKFERRFRRKLKRLIR